MANVAINVEVRSNGEVVLGKVGDQLEAVGKKAKESKSQMESFMESMKEGIGIGAGFAAGAVAAEKLIEVLREIPALIEEGADWAENLGKAMATTGLGSRDVQQLAAEFKAMGYEAGDLTSMVVKSNKAIEEGSKVVTQLGLSFDALKDQTPTERLETLSQAILNIQSPVERSAAAMALFGKSGAELIPLFDKIASGAYRMNAALGDDAVKQLYKADEAIDEFTKKWDYFKRSFAAGAVKEISTYGGATDLWGMAGDYLRGLTGTYNKEKTITAPRVGGMTPEQWAIFNKPDRFLDKSPLSLGKETDEQRKAVEGYKGAGKAAEEYHKLVEKFQERGRAMAQKQNDEILKDAEKSAVFKLGVEEKYWKEVERQGKDAAKRRQDLEEETGAEIEKQREYEFEQWVKAEERAFQKNQEMVSSLLNIGSAALSMGADVGGAFGSILMIGGAAVNVFANLSDKALQSASNVQKAAVAAQGLMSAYNSGGFLSGAAAGAAGGAAFGLVGAGIGAVVGGIAGLFGGGKKKEEERKKEAEQFAQMTDQIKQQFGSLAAAASMADKYGVNLQRALDSKKPKELDAALKELEKRMKGLETATEGVKTLIDNLTYTDAAGNLMDTFSDPAVVGSAANLFSVQFWQVFQKQGIAGLDKMRPAWSKLLGDLTRMGLDPVAMGLGRVGRMMDLTNDPKTRALLGASQGVGQMLRGSMDAGYLDKGMLADASNVAKATLKELQDNGMTAAEAAQAQEDQLAALADAYKQTGQEMPDWLKDAMSAAGMELLPTQLDVLKESRDYLKEIAGARGYAGGGIVTERQLAWVGENGPEEIMPMDGTGYQGGRRGGLNVNIYRAPGMTRETEAAFDRRVARIMDRTLRQDARVRASARAAVNGGR